MDSVEGGDEVEGIRLCYMKLFRLLLTIHSSMHFLAVQKLDTFLLAQKGDVDKQVQDIAKVLESKLHDLMNRGGRCRSWTANSIGAVGGEDERVAVIS